MARVTLNIAKAYDDGLIENIEKTKYFQLHKNAASRTDLYCFAIALCEMEEKEGLEGEEETTEKNMEKEIKKEIKQ